MYYVRIKLIKDCPEIGEAWVIGQSATVGRELADDLVGKGKAILDEVTADQILDIQNPEKEEEE